MHRHTGLRVALGIATLLALSSSLATGSQQEPIEAPNPGVPEIYTIQGEFVRVAYNNEGYISLGYRVANQSVGEEWMLLEVGLTVLKADGNYVLKRDAVSLSTPDGKTHPLPSNKEFRGAYLQALEKRASVVRDSINYFPRMAHRACRIGFFAELDSPAMPWDQVELSQQRACVGRLYFKIPGGIQHGQHFLNIQFANSKVRAPFTIMTDEQEKMFHESWQDIKKELDAAFEKAVEKNQKN